jgi:hypothetical protein
MQARGAGRRKLASGPWALAANARLYPKLRPNDEIAG